MDKRERALRDAIEQANLREYERLVFKVRLDHPGSLIVNLAGVPVAFEIAEAMRFERTLKPSPPKRRR